MQQPRALYETLTGEGLKEVSERLLQNLGSFAAGGEVLERYAFRGGRRFTHQALATEVVGISLENPILIGAGWDKIGRALHGLYHLGFAGAEIGTVVPEKQDLGTRPRLFTLDSGHSVGLNRYKFKSPGADVVARYLEAARPLPFPIGLNVGRNMHTPNDRAGLDHQRVVQRLGDYASYIALGISSVNTPNLRELQSRQWLPRIIHSGRYGILEPLPLLVKIDPERSHEELNEMIDICVAEGVDGIIATNSYGGSDLKAKYGQRWTQEAGGLSGADSDFRRLATECVRFIYEKAGHKLDIIGVGGVDSADSVLEKIRAGASAVQVVTAMRPSWGRIAADTIRELLACYVRGEFTSIKQQIGANTRRGPKYFSGNS